MAIISRGPMGPKGDTGPKGPQGLAGPKGDKGDTGDKGADGISNIPGPAGPKGATGDRGLQGLKGDTGSQGPQGLKGDAGDRGPIGLTGAQGPQGLKGDTGERGLLGERGPQGLKGDTGLQGVKGDRGDPGTKGDKGDPGPTGPAGLRGQDGAPGSSGPQGPAGSKGDKGDPGSSGYGAGPAFIATMTTGSLIAISPLTVTQRPLIYNNVSKNDGNGFNATTGIFTAPSSGYYQVSAAFAPGLIIGTPVYDSNYGAGMLGVYKNNLPIAAGPWVEGKAAQYGPYIAAAVDASSISTLIYLTAGETLQTKFAYITNWNGFTTLANTVPNYFQAVWIRA